MTFLDRLIKACFVLIGIGLTANYLIVGITVMLPIFVFIAVVAVGMRFVVYSYGKWFF